MDAFYASIEQRDNKALYGRPVIVGGSPDERSVVCAASYEARRYGVRSAMPVKTAARLCPEAVILKPDFRKYQKVSKEIRALFFEYSDLVEPISLDECYLDVTVNKKNIPYATEIAKEIRSRIKSNLNLTASAGVAPNKLLAKIASDINKPDGLFVVKPRNVEDFVKNLEVGELWGVGKVTNAKLKEMGVKTCGDLQRYSILDLVKIFGVFGETLYYYCRGIDDSPVYDGGGIKSIGSEITLPIDTDDVDDLIIYLNNEINIAYNRLKKYNILCKTVTLKVKFFDFTRISRSKTFSCATDSFDEIRDEIESLLRNLNIEKKIRLIGVSFSNFTDKADCATIFDISG
ncbi:MAG TPA: DNA polymerase IV [Spirochaetota bacterium]|jgi:DNA polymerase-4|nr:MAG: DNA polymerase IV [Spirochaetes bacterium ADurb.Bin133]HNZ28002.1 DNA polymerase IV [Spirochaetota bacterium]HPY87998.1 DNA polymerase IV [Spirochaetota bacterium]